MAREGKSGHTQGVVPQHVLGLAGILVEGICIFKGNIIVRKGIKMKIFKSIKLTAISMLLVVGLGACNKPGPAETAGKKMDQTADKAGKNIDDAADKVSEKLNEKK